MESNDELISNDEDWGEAIAVCGVAKENYQEGDNIFSSGVGIIRVQKDHKDYLNARITAFKKAFISSIGRVILGPIIGYLLIVYYNLEGFAAGVLLIQCSMPSAILNYLVGSIYSPKKIVDNVASMIVVSTLMSFITIPLVVFFALKYFI